MKPESLPIEVRMALAECDRSPGWNNRSRDIRRFELAGRWGEPCTLYVVPFRCWAYRRMERQVQAWREGKTA
jgi:hypothetical protein